MLDLDLTAAERQAFEDALADSGRRIRSSVRLLNRNEQPVGELAKFLSAASVQVSTDGDVSRSLTLELGDPTEQIRIEPNSPSDRSIYVDRFIAAEYGVYVGELARWVDVPVFWGPVTEISRSGGHVSVEAQGKERLMLAPHLATKGYTIRRGTTVKDGIEHVGRQAGEARFDLPELSGKVRRPRAVSRTSEPWKVIVGGEQNAKGRPIAGLIEKADAEYGVYYDGRGRLTARRKAAPPVFTITDDHLGEQRPTIGYDTETFRNTVFVQGGRKKKHPRAHGSATLPANHPLSAQSLGRNGEPRYLTEVVDADSLKSDAKCRRRAREILDRLSVEGLTASLTCVPIPHLEEEDMIIVKADGYSLNMPLREWTLPLISGAMTIGTLKQVRR